MTNQERSDFQREIKYGKYLHAYEKLVIAFEKNPKDESLPELSQQLVQPVRKKAMDLGYNKAREMTREAGEADVLHRLVKLFISKL